MKTIFKLIKKIIFIFFWIKFFFLLLPKKDIIIFDIDNTVADTWPSFLKKKISEHERLSNLKAFKNIVNLILNYDSEGKKIIFMSARNYKFYNITKIWIKKNCTKAFDLILVSNVSEKLKFLKIFKNKKITLYDDLSYSHEKKRGVLFYEDIIKELKKLNYITYIGYNELLTLQKKNCDK